MLHCTDISHVYGHSLPNLAKSVKSIKLCDFSLYTSSLPIPFSHIKLKRALGHGTNTKQKIEMCPSGSGGILAAEIATARSDFRTAFEILDADRDGKISRADLSMFYTGLSSGADDEEDVIGSMISAADLNKDGFVEYDEFERVLGGGDGKKRRNNGVMEDVFKVMDKDGDGKLSHDDLKSYMTWAGFDACDDDIKAMIRLGGGEKKDGVCYDDLLKILAVY